MRTFLEITVGGNEEQRELLIPTMVELGCSGFQETDTSLLCYVDISGWGKEELSSFTGKMKSLLREISSNASISTQEIIDQNWNEQWERTITPIEIGRNIIIKPSWSDYRNKENRIVIQIDPKMSFGTGYHETTRLTLRLLEDSIAPGMRVLDVGTGTGVLAIAAMKLGARSAVGIDIDEWSIENALENVEANSLSDAVLISDREIDSFDPHSFDLITANLTLNTNIELLDEFCRVLRPGGRLLLSGLLKADELQMKEHLRAHGLEIAGTLTENEWIAIDARISG